VKIVLDTNVLFSAFATHGLCSRILRICIARHGLIASEHILSELERHLAGKLKLPEEAIGRRIALLRWRAMLVQPVEVPGAACRDPNDLPIIGTAVAGGADFIVTGDQDLLELGSYQGIQIVSPRQLHDKLS
jgi:uncharacterized protein